MAGASITYVRHAMPVVEEGVESAHWHLDDATRASTSSWADRLEVGDGIAGLKRALCALHGTSPVTRVG